MDKIYGVDRRRDGYTEDRDVLTNVMTDRQKGNQMDLRETDGGQIDGQIDGWTDRRIDELTERDRQTDKSTDEWIRTDEYMEKQRETEGLIT
jgi:hypothetical protein